jgi:hypothetical protein
MQKPFQYFASALGERIKDEMSDIKAAGGYFSIAKRQEQPFVKTFDQALEFTQKNNAILAKLAASLPGSTQEYIEVSKRIGDSVARTVMQDKGAAVAYANELRRQFPTMYGGQLQGQGVEAQKGAISTLLGELTKKTVLAGQGGRSGAGGAMGPYGLPGLTERMLSQDQVSMGQFQRYSAIFSDPMIMDALQREIPRINATAKNSIERFKALQKFYDDVLPPEMIEKYRRSIAGLNEAFNTAVLGPETGLFGLGRKMKGLGRKINDFGQYVDELGNVVDDVNKAATIDLSVFDMLRDILANTAQVLMPIVENITLIYDPLKMIGLSMKDARHYTAEFLKSFNQYRDGLEEYAKTLSKAMGGKLLETKDLRASFAAISNLFKQLGVFSESQFKDISKQILDPNANVGNILKGLIDTFLNSDAAFKVGEFIGNLVGTVLSEVAKAMGFVTGMATGGPLAKGLMKGFKSAGGAAAFTSIIRNTFALIGKFILDIVKSAPMETAILGAIMVAPAVISGLISAGVTSLFGSLFSAQVLNFAKTKLMNLMASAMVQWSVMTTTPAAAGAALSGGAATGGAAASGGFAAAIARMLPLLGKLSLVLTAITLIGGGLESTLRQLGQFFGELGHNISGAFGGLFDLLGVLGGSVGDLGRRFGDLIAPMFGLSQGFDGLKLVLAPITLVFQAFSQGLRGLALAFAELRVFLARITGDPEYQKRIQERDKMASDLAADRGRINAYNASMLGPESLKKQLNNAVFELQNSTTLKASRSAELKAFIAEARGQTTTQSSIATPPAKTPTPLTGPPSQGAAVPAEVKQTATNIQQINQKAATQVTHAAGIKTEAAGTKKNTATAVTTLGNIRQGMIAVSNKLSSIQSGVLGDLNNIQAGVAKISSLLSSGSLKVKTDAPAFPGFPGGVPMGGAQGNLGAAQSLASQSGLSLTSFFRPGDPGMHGVGRAMDFSNGVNTPQQMAFAQQMIARYGSSLAELIYTPLGFGIKNGQKVPLSYWGERTNAMHYNHVHVAFANGKEDGKMFSSKSAAGGWENSMVPGSVKVASVTANSGDGGGFGAMTVNNSITINQLPGQSTDELASIVALKIGEAVSDARAASIFV